MSQSALDKFLDEAERVLAHESEDVKRAWAAYNAKHHPDHAVVAKVSKELHKHTRAHPELILGMVESALLLTIAIELLIMLLR